MRQARLTFRFQSQQMHWSSSLPATVVPIAEATSSSKTLAHQRSWRWRHPEDPKACWRDFSTPQSVAGGRRRRRPERFHQKKQESAQERADGSRRRSALARRCVNSRSATAAPGTARQTRLEVLLPCIARSHSVQRCRASPDGTMRAGVRLGLQFDAVRCDGM